MAIKRADVAMLHEAMRGLRESQYRALENNQRRRRAAAQGERADKRLALDEGADRRRALEAELRRTALEAEMERKRRTPFDETLRVTRDYQNKKAELSEAMRAARQRGDRGEAARLQGQLQALDEQAKAMAQKGREKGTLEPMVKVTADGAGGEKMAMEVPYSQLSEFGFELPSAEASDEESGFAAKKRGELNAELTNLMKAYENRSKEARKWDAGDIVNWIPGVPNDKQRLEKIESRAKEIERELSEMGSKEKRAEAIKERYRSGEITKGEAMKRLEALRDG